jgi:hypothetical protein
MPKSKKDISLEEARRILGSILDAQDSDWWAETNVEEVIEVELSVALLYDIQKWIDDNWTVQ